MDALGERIRTLRTAQGLTLDDLAVRSGVSRAMLSKIERDEKNPTVRVAALIAEGLRVSLSRLLGDDERRRVVVVPHGSQRIITDDATGYTRQLLSPVFAGAGVEVVRCAMPPGTASGTFPAHPQGTEEYIAVERGQVHIRLDDRDEYVLTAGDALFFAADVSHAFTNADAGESVFYLVIDRTAAR